MTLHIVEPTLVNNAGHCLTVIQSLVDVAPSVASDTTVASDTNFCLWVGKQADPKLICASNVRLMPFFSRKWRRVQLYFLFRRLLGDGQRLFVLTASQSELFSYAMIPKSLRQKGKVIFFIHQMQMDDKRLDRLHWLARRAPETRILATTEHLTDTIRHAGFRSVRHQPYPVAIDEVMPKTMPFRHVIFPGMARIDKNLALVGRVIETMHQQGCSIPMCIQAAPNHHGEFASDIVTLLENIRHIGYPHLTIPQQAMDAGSYREQFCGGICLQPFHVVQYANKVSGVTIDALAQLAPVVVRAHIWAAKVVAQFDAGIVVDSDDPDVWLNAIKTIIASYSSYQANCRRAYHYLRQEHDPASLLAILKTLP